MKATQPIYEEPANPEPVTLVEGRTLKPGHELASLLILLILNAFLHGWPLLVTNGMVTVFLAFLLTYVGLPLTTRLFHSWLYPQEK